MSTARQASALVVPGASSEGVGAGLWTPSPAGREAGSVLVFLDNLWALPAGERSRARAELERARAFFVAGSAPLPYDPDPRLEFVWLLRWRTAAKLVVALRHSLALPSPEEKLQRLLLEALSYGRHRTVREDALLTDIEDSVSSDYIVDVIRSLVLDRKVYNIPKEAGTRSVSVIEKERWTPVETVSPIGTEIEGRVADAERDKYRLPEHRPEDVAEKIADIRARLDQIDKEIRSIGYAGPNVQQVEELALRLQQQSKVAFKRVPQEIYPGMPYTTADDIEESGEPGYSHAYVYRLAKEKQIDAVQMDGATLITPRGYEQLRQRAQKRASGELGSRGGRRPGPVKERQSRRKQPRHRQMPPAQDR